MPLDYRGECVHVASSNRAPLYFDGSMTQTQLVTPGFVTLQTGVWASGTGGANNTLLGANSSKLIQIIAFDGKPWIAQKVQIINGSGFTANLSLTIARDRVSRPTQTANPQAGANYDVSQGQTNPNVFEVMKYPLILLSGDTITLEVRVWQILELNPGGSAQTGNGVRYVVTNEPFLG